MGKLEKRMIETQLKEKLSKRAVKAPSFKSWVECFVAIEDLRREIARARLGALEGFEGRIQAMEAEIKRRIAQGER